MTSISNGESGLSVRTKLNASLAVTDAFTVSSGNVGIGTTSLSAWSGFKALEFPGAFYGSNNGGTGLWWGQNTYYNGTNWIYKTTAAASYHEVVGNVFRWYAAPSGTAGNAITFTQAMTLNASGNLGIGTTSPNAASILDAQSTTKGVRFPNMTTAQKTAMANVAGNVVFDTTLGKLCVNTGAGWQTITSV